MAKADLILEESKEIRDKILGEIQNEIKYVEPEVTERKKSMKMRKDFWEGNHHLYTNVIGLRDKSQEGHILAVFNYVWKMGNKLQESLTNFPFKLKLKSEDEGDEIENIRTEAVEKFINKTLSDNDFLEVIFPRCGTVQVRDGDFAVKCTVIGDENGKAIKIDHAEDMVKVYVMWDDAAGKSFSALAFVDEWALTKVEQEFDGYQAVPITETTQEGDGSHLNDQYGVLTASITKINPTPTGKTRIPKTKVCDYWGKKQIKGEWKVVNAIVVGAKLNDMIQFIVTDYDEIPWYIGHSFPNPPSPWSMAFIDPLIDPNVELNDRQSEEGDLIRAGSHVKWLVVNMPDFDEKLVKPGSGQCIFIEGPDADFRPLLNNTNAIPSEAYLNRIMEHLFTIGLPKIAFAAGTAPYTGRVGAIQYQSVIDPVNKLRLSWNKVIKDLCYSIQNYMIKFFPETHSYMRSHEGGEDGDLIIREVELDWENIMPLSKSDLIVDASTLFDRDAISHRKYLELSGINDAPRVIKELKTEAKDEELLTARGRFKQLSSAAVRAQLKAMQATREQEEANAELMGMNQGGSPQRPKPIMNEGQNQGERRGVSAARGVPQTGEVSQAGAAAMAQQNLNAQG
jgi:hypothetical protein